MGFDALFQHIMIRRFFAGMIDFGLSFASGLLGGYFGAMMAALVIVLKDSTPWATQRAIWTGMIFGFVFWSFTVSWVNRVLVQGISRSSIGKKLMNLEIVSTGEPISWQVMMKHWISATLVGEIKVVSSLDTSKLAPVYSIHSRPASSSPAAVNEESSNKKVA